MGFIDPEGRQLRRVDRDHVAGILSATRAFYDLCGGSPQCGIALAMWLHGAGGPMDFRLSHPDTEFDVPGHGILREDEFGNYVAGYGTGYSMGCAGYGGSRIAGAFFAGLDDELGDDPASVYWIDRGYEDGTGARRGGAAARPPRRATRPPRRSWTTWW